MKKMLSMVMLSFMAQMFSATYTVDGYAFLEGETDHSGIEVFFQRVAPDASFSYTVYTNSAGYYSRIVENGWYDVHFSKNEFLTDSITDAVAYSAITLPDVNLNKDYTISGSLSGILYKGEYVAGGNITVDSGDTLLIEAGTIIKFSLNTEMIIRGTLLAEGTETDSIKFTSLPGSSWLGLSFISCDNPPIFRYCVVNNSVSSGIYADTPLIELSDSHIYNNSSGDDGGGIRSVSDTCRVSHCIVDNNKAASYSGCGGGIYALGGELLISNSKVTSNSTDDAGGGIYVYACTLVAINDTEISNNIQMGSYHGGGICASGSQLFISNSKITSNAARYGGGVAIVNTTWGAIENSVISSNTAEYPGGYGGGIYHNSSSKFDYINLTIANNTNGGIFYYSLTSQNIVECIISGNAGYGVRSYSSDYLPSLSFCDISGNTPSNMYNCGSYLGVIVTTNSNGDPCDAWSNISLDPKFVNVSSGDFRLQSDSPCIDAGTNTITGYTFPLTDLDGNQRIWDGDGNGSEIVDMGVYEYIAIFAPQNLTITSTSSSTQLSWTASSGASSYKVYSSENPYASFPTGWSLVTSGVTGTSWTDLSATGTKKFYVVVAVSAKEDENIGKVKFKQR